MTQDESAVAVSVDEPDRPDTVAGYPALSREARGILKLMWRKSRVEDDWSKGGAISDCWDRWSGWPLTAKPTYDLSATVRSLSRLSREVPAWRDTIGEAAGATCRRMRGYASWWDWIEQPGLDPNRNRYPFAYYKNLIPHGFAGVYNAPGYAGNGLPVTGDGMPQAVLLAGVRANPTVPYTYRHSPAMGRTFDSDPVRAHGSSNIMYKGYYLEQLAHLQAITGDAEWREPQHLVYDDVLQFDYSAEDITRIMSEQFRAPMDAGGSPLIWGLDCEVGKVFPYCVAIAGCGMQLFDEVNGTSYAEAYREWQRYGTENWFSGGENASGHFTWSSLYFDRDLGYNMNRPENQMPSAWTLLGVHTLPSDPVWARRQYESAFDRFGLEEDGTLRLMLPPELVGPLVVFEDIWAMAEAMVMANDFGDTDRLQKMRAWGEEHWEPVYKDGEFYYDLNLGETWPRGLINSYLSMQMVGGVGDYAAMYASPNLDKFDQPTLSKVDYPQVAVTQAVFDPEVGHLVVGITPGCDASVIGAPTTFTISQLQGTTRKIIEDGVESSNWRPGNAPGEIEIQSTVGPHTFLIR
jgi:hypothetical protein